MERPLCSMMSSLLAAPLGRAPQPSSGRGSHVPSRGAIPTHSRQQQPQAIRSVPSARTHAVSAVHLQTSRESCRLQRVPRKPRWLQVGRRHAALQCTAVVAGSAAEPGASAWDWPYGCRGPSSMHVDPCNVSMSPHPREAAARSSALSVSLGSYAARSAAQIRLSAASVEHLQSCHSAYRDAAR